MVVVQVFAFRLSMQSSGGVHNAMCTVGGGPGEGSPGYVWVAHRWVPWEMAVHGWANCEVQ